MATVAGIRELDCPGCGERITGDARFVTWCQSCEWNVDPSPAQRLGWRERRARQASERASRRLFEQISAQGSHSAPSQTALIAFVSLLVHALTASVLAGAVALAIIGLRGPVALVVPAAYLLAVGLCVQPFRFHRHRDLRPLQRADAPALFALTDEIAACVGASGLDGITISPRFNASIVRLRKHGWVMDLGLALWSVLEPQEKVAVIGHELGHQVNRDQRRSFLVRGATRTMATWAYVLKPGGRITPLRGLAVLGETLAAIAMLPFALAAGALSNWLATLAARQGLAAEYYADVLAARAGGTQAATAGLEKLLVADACSFQLIQTVKYDKSADPWEHLASYAADIPEHERERQRRLGRLRLPAIDSSHPPTQLRADLVRSLAPAEPQVVLSPEREAAITQEISKPAAAATRRLRSRYPG
ncbi:MAG TPA: M48 family metallopeptidase [Solirubrobacteraceae bacterium]|nr:M48 family metallopeptidase [Solirubrobacteraceae bacterium]